MQLFGVGWGYTRGSNMFTTLLINVGALGLAIAVAAFLYPIFKLGNDLRSQGLKAAVLVLLVTLMIAVPEYGYPSMWLFLGIAYHEVLEVRATPVPECAPDRDACIRPNARGESSMIKRITAATAALFALGVRPEVPGVLPTVKQADPSAIVIGGAVDGNARWTERLVELGGMKHVQGLESAVLVILSTCVVLVPEYGYLSTWLFLGMAYNEISSVEEVSALGGGKALIPAATAIHRTGRT